jgi:hypothetical protein
MIARSVVRRRGGSLYLSIDLTWRDPTSLDIGDTCRLEIEEVGDASVTVALYIDEDYSTVADPPGQFDIDQWISRRVSNGVCQRMVAVNSVFRRSSHTVPNTMATVRSITSSRRRQFAMSGCLPELQKRVG